MPKGVQKGVKAPKRGKDVFAGCGKSVQRVKKEVLKGFKKMVVKTLWVRTRGVRCGVCIRTHHHSAQNQLRGSTWHFAMPKMAFDVHKWHCYVLKMAL